MFGNSKSLFDIKNEEKEKEEDKEEEEEEEEENLYVKEPVRKGSRTYRTLLTGGGLINRRWRL